MNCEMINYHTNKITPIHEILIGIEKTDGFKYVEVEKIDYEQDNIIVVTHDFHCFVMVNEGFEYISEGFPTYPCAEEGRMRCKFFGGKICKFFMHWADKGKGRIVYYAECHAPLTI